MNCVSTLRTGVGKPDMLNITILISEVMRRIIRLKPTAMLVQQVRYISLTDYNIFYDMSRGTTCLG